MIFRDTLTRRLMISILAAMVAGAVLDLLLSLAVGRWSEPPLDRSGLPQAAAVVSHILEAAPVSARAAIAREASGPGLRVVVHDRDPFTPATEQRLRRLRSSDFSTSAIASLRLRPDQVLVARSGDYPGLDVGPGRTPGGYMLFVPIASGQWIEFMVPRRTWGTSEAIKRSVIFALLLSCATVIAMVSARRLGAPLRRVADDIGRVGTNLDAAPLAPQGPRELRNVILAVNQMQARIARFVQERTLLLATVSHDLRTPLTRMRLGCEMMDDQAAAGTLLENIDEMSGMIESAMAVFKGEHRPDSAVLLDVAALVSVVLDEFADAGAANVPLRGGRGLLVRGEPIALKRAVRNLVDNAIRYARDVEVEIRPEEDWVAIEVLDRGPGAPPDFLPQMLQPFTTRSPRGEDGVREGFGLGLTSAQTIALAHGGVLRVDNRAGGGLRAALRLPGAAPGPAEARLLQSRHPNAAEERHLAHRHGAIEEAPRGGRRS
jgi:signal transduction histidine kinase